MTLRELVLARPRLAHVFARDAHDRYVEPAWCSRRLFEVEWFVGVAHDPAAGSGQIVRSARLAGLKVTQADIAPIRRTAHSIDFFADETERDNVISNPPYGRLREFAEHALAHTRKRVALLVPLARLNAAGAWLRSTPLRRVWLLTPRPSIPPHSVILAGEKPQGGRVDFCWLVWEQGFAGAPELRWLHRDGTTP